MRVNMTMRDQTIHAAYRRYRTALQDLEQICLRVPVPLDPNPPSLASSWPEEALQTFYHPPQWRKPWTRRP